MSDWYVSSAAYAAIAAFVPSGVYTLGQIVKPTAPAFNAQYAFRCTTAGTASTEPAWPAANNATVTTGGATFTNVSGQSTYGWSAAAGNSYAIGNNGASPRITAGDRIFMSSDHSESSASNYFITTTGAYGVIQFISVNRAGSVPPVAGDYLAGATIAITSGAPWILDCYVNIYWQGVTISFSGTSGGISLANGGNKGHYFKNCALVLNTASANIYIQPQNPCQITLDGTTVQFGAASQRINLVNTGMDFRWINTPSAVLGTAPATLFLGPGGTILGTAVCRGVDLSAVTGTLYYSGSASVGKVLFDSCRIASGVVRLGTAAYAVSADEVELVNCYNGTSFLSERHTPAGDVTTEFSTTMTGGAQDDVGLFSHKMVSSARCDPWSMTLDSFWMDVENTNIGSARTATIEIVSSASLNNTDISLLLEYQGTSGSSLASFTSTLPSALTASAAVPTSTATWNSPPSTPVYQHLQATFTPRAAGRVRGYVRLGKASTTVWINPVIVIT